MRQITSPCARNEAQHTEAIGRPLYLLTNTMNPKDTVLIA